MAYFPRGRRRAGPAILHEDDTASGVARLAGDRSALAPDNPCCALEVAGLSHAFGPRKALNDVSFSVQRGEFTALLGLNGAGKTTLFSLITRLYDHRSGSIRIFGDALKAAPSRALSRMGIVFQQSTLDLDLTVEQNLLYHGALHGLGHRTIRERIAREVARLDLQARLGDKVRQLSGGQRRRVEIARALLHDPDLLLLDEPTVGLDVASRQFLIDHVRGLCRDQGIAVLWATHLIDEVDVTGRVIVLHRGLVRAQGQVAGVCAAAHCSTMREAFDHLTRDAAS
jgi:ABC-2 type transport system ATP-binding protein